MQVLGSVSLADKTFEPPAVAANAARAAAGKAEAERKKAERAASQVSADAAPPCVPLALGAYQMRSGCAVSARMKHRPKAATVLHLSMCKSNSWTQPICCTVELSGSAPNSASRVCKSCEGEA